MPHEREVLFDLGATFEIEDIKQRSKKKDYITICLTPSCEGAHILYEFRQECRNEIENSSSALTFGALLFKTNKYAAAQRYFEQLLDAPNNENISEIYHYLGWTHLEQDDYGQAIVNFERAHDVILESDGISRAKVLNSIGKALVDKGFIQESLSYYKRALGLRVACLNPEHEDVANSYANVGHLYNLAGNRNLAMEYYNKSVRTDTASVKSLNRANYTETNEEVDSINSSISGSYSFDGLHQSSKYSSISGFRFTQYETIVKN
jgi:tetratricopeptide (TPR) repeat protein